MHKSVLLKETIDGLDIKAGDVIVDATLGGGGHSAEICRRFGKAVRIIGLDQDQGALEKAAEHLNKSDCNITFKLSNFRDIGEALSDSGIGKADKILADLGLSTFQLDLFERGFSFQKDQPLLMTFKANPGKEDITAQDIVNDWSEENITQILWGYGEERYGRRIAKAIAESRDKKMIETTAELVEIIRGAVPKSYQHMKSHFATRTFQALRIAVNDELRTLGEFLKASFEYLNPGGRIAVITFHSLEDRIVKRFFKGLEKEKKVRLINKKPIIPGTEEAKENKRSRSAKLRIMEKI